MDCTDYFNYCCSLHHFTLFHFTLHLFISLDFGALYITSLTSLHLASLHFIWIYCSLCYSVGFTCYRFTSTYRSFTLFHLNLLLQGCMYTAHHFNLFHSSLLHFTAVASFHCTSLSSIPSYRIILVSCESSKCFLFIFFLVVTCKLFR